MMHSPEITRQIILYAIHAPFVIETIIIAIKRGAAFHTMGFQNDMQC
jgi:hypothetical protein